MVNSCVPSVASAKASPLSLILLCLMKITPVPPLHRLQLVRSEEPVRFPLPALHQSRQRLSSGKHPLLKLPPYGVSVAALLDRLQQRARLQLVEPQVKRKAHQRIKLRLRRRYMQPVHQLLHIVEVRLQQVLCPVLRYHVSRPHVRPRMSVPDGQHPRSVIIRLCPQTLKLLELVQANVTYSHLYYFV